MKRLRQLLPDDLSLNGGAPSALLKNRFVTGLAGAVLLFFLLATSFGGDPLGKQLIVGVSNAAQSLRSIVAADTASWNAPTLPATPVLYNLPSHRIPRGK